MLDFAIFLRLQVESTMGGWEVGEGQDTAQPTIAFPASTPTADRGFYSSPTNSCEGFFFFLIHVFSNFDSNRTHQMILMNSGISKSDLGKKSF